MANDVDFITNLHAYNDIRSFLTEETNNKLVSELGIQDGLERRIAGLNCEHEFALMAYFSEQFDYILGFDESFSKLKDTKTPDFLLKHKNGKKYFVEVKSTKSTKFEEITATSLSKRKAFADELGAEWSLALKIYGRWSFFDYNTFVSKKRKIKDSRDLNDSSFLSLFDFNYYVVRENVIAESVFNKESTETDCIRHKDYGELINYTLKAGSKVLIDKSIKNRSIFVEELHNQFSNQKVENVDAYKTKLIETLDNPILVSTDQCMMASILRTISRFGTLNDAKTFFDDFINHRFTSSNVFAYKAFWQTMIDKCDNHEIFMPTPTDISFNEDGSFTAVLREKM